MVQKCVIYTHRQGCNKKNFQGGQSHFSRFFSGEILGFSRSSGFFPVLFTLEISDFPHFLFHFLNFSSLFSFHVPFFPHFPLHFPFFPFFPRLIFPDLSPKISWSKVSGRHSAPTPPVTPLHTGIHVFAPELPIYTVLTTATAYLKSGHIQKCWCFPSLNNETFRSDSRSFRVFGTTKKIIYMSRV